MPGYTKPNPYPTLRYPYPKPGGLTKPVPITKWEYPQVLPPKLCSPLLSVGAVMRGVFVREQMGLGGSGGREELTIVARRVTKMASY